ncbi:hypothetical protein [Kocuria rhizophila]|uniref:hypothetical protein n=1 Tax=Kocuria rhizophila TaxID=72000 RepID=UPI001EF5970B|nr:hypothetical protein [Kocuria rhizophila]
MDWLKQYEAWMGDHQARLDAADKQIAEGKTQIDAARKDLTQAQSDIAAGVREAALERARLDQVGARLDQTNRDLLAAGTRIGANETALAGAQKRLESAETTLQVTDQNLTTLEGTVGDVSAKAEASEQKALEALNKAGTAQAAADGKTTITRAVEPRTTQPGTAVGDTHFTMSSMGGGGQVLRQQRWDGSTWQDEALSHQVIASLDLGKATVGELDGGRVAARSLSSDRLVVGVSGNLIVDPNFNDSAVSSWRLGDRWQWVTDGTEKCFRAVADGTNANMSLNGGVSREPSLPVTAGTTYALELDASGYLWVYMRVRYANGAVETPGSSIQYSTGRLDRRKVAFVIKPDEYTHANAAGTKPVAVTVYVRQPSNAPLGSATAVYSARFAPRSGTVLIEDGAVTGDKIEASTVSGALGQFLKVESQTGVFTDSLTGRNARLLGETVAESINITGTLRGRDAILSGTVDVGQLNVTGEMSAKIILASDVNARRGFFTEGLTAQDAALLGTTVAEKLVVTDAFSARVVNAMTAQTKQLVVTEDAILNRATVVQSLVTPELIASKVDARYLRADNIKTGLLEVFGRFRTAPDGQPQIIIQPSQAAWNSKDLAIWFTPDGTTPGGGDAMMYAVTGGMWMNPAGGGGRSESLWTAQQLNLRGQSRAGVRIMDGLTLQATAGTVGPVINSHNGQFLQLIGSDGIGLTTLTGGARITPNGAVDIVARNGNVYLESSPADSEVRLHAGSKGVRFTTSGGNTASYGKTTSSQANLNMDSATGTIYRVTSSRRYKKYISDYTFDVTRLRDVRLRKWRDRKQAGQDEDPNYYYGAIAEEIYELYPEHVPMIADPTWDGDGPAPMIPDSIAYDRLALGAAVAGWQDTDRRLTEANHLIQSLETRVTQLEGTTHA